MKTHLHIDSPFLLGSASRACDWRSNTNTTTNIEDVDCLNCKKTREYKNLKEQKKRDFKKQVDQEMEDVKNEALYGFKEKDCSNDFTDFQNMLIKLGVPFRVDIDHDIMICADYSNGNRAEIHFNMNEKLTIINP